MNDGLKQRIVGALVLVALGVIFVPVVFDKGRFEPVDRTSQIPHEPTFSALPIPEKAVAPQLKDPQLDEREAGAFLIDNVETLDDLVGKDEAVGQAEVVDAKPVSSSAADIEHSESTGLAQPWVLQVASFTRDERAQVLKKRLIDLDYKSFTRVFDTSKGKRIRVFIGPNIDKAALADAKADVDGRFKIESILVKYK